MDIQGVLEDHNILRTRIFCYHYRTHMHEMDKWNYKNMDKPYLTNNSHTSLSHRETRDICHLL